MSNFWRFHDLPLINCKVELELRWAENCVISGNSITAATGAGVNPIEAITTTGATFQINNVKRYVSVVTLYINDNIKFLDNIKQGFERTISWNKYRT